MDKKVLPPTGENLMQEREMTGGSHSLRQRAGAAAAPAPPDTRKASGAQK